MLTSTEYMLINKPSAGDVFMTKAYNDLLTAVQSFLDVCFVDKPKTYSRRLNKVRAIFNENKDFLVSKGLITAAYDAEGFLDCIANEDSQLRRSSISLNNGRNGWNAYDLKGYGEIVELKTDYQPRKGDSVILKDKFGEKSFVEWQGCVHLTVVKYFKDQGVV